MAGKKPRNPVLENIIIQARKQGSLANSRKKQSCVHRVQCVEQLAGFKDERKGHYWILALSGAWLTNAGKRGQQGSEFRFRYAIILVQRLRLDSEVVCKHEKDQGCPRVQMSLVHSLPHNAGIRLQQPH